MSKDLVLVATYYKDDGWYGKRYRVMLSITPGVGFETKTAARQHITKFKQHLKQTRNLKGKDVTITCNERDSYVEYTHISNGPSLFYKHTNISVIDLD